MKEVKKSPLKKIWEIATTVIVVLLVLFAVALMGARVAGLKVYTIVSGSMYPAYKTGDLIYVKKVEAETIKVGDPITFVLNEDLVVATHRVISIDYENRCFYTKGDNNQVADTNPVHFENLIGKPIFRIPYLGAVSDWIQSPPGLYIALAIGVALLGIVFIPDLFIKANIEEEKARLEAEKAKLEEKLAKLNEAKSGEENKTVDEGTEEIPKTRPE